ncbi:LuxR C-terminal-related transcriptional regulator [Nocardiopsis sediminis]|uniref:LuxR C-terminal-related transcriptional regulator n=1 Tax=Nocardiopsis sediminis TaxID=1778267 RepID=A0ABV8FFS4_9ACTN
MLEANDGIRVFLAHEHDVVRRGMRAWLTDDDGIEVVGEATGAAEARARIPAAAPHVALLDAGLPDRSGVEVCRELGASMPDLACLIVASLPDDDALYDAVMAGASGYVLTGISGADLIGAIRTVAAGESLLDPRSTSRMMRRMREEAREDPLAVLSGQERQVFELIGEGLTNRQIGERIFVAEKTVKNYVSGVLSKLDMQRRTQVASYAARLRAESSLDPPG